MARATVKGTVVQIVSNNTVGTSPGGEEFRLNRLEFVLNTDKNDAEKQSERLIIKAGENQESNMLTLITLSLVHGLGVGITFDDANNRVDGVNLVKQLLREACDLSETWTIDPVTSDLLNPLKVLSELVKLGSDRTFCFSGISNNRGFVKFSKPGSFAGTGKNQDYAGIHYCFEIFPSFPSYEIGSRL